VAELREQLGRIKIEGNRLRCRFLLPQHFHELDVLASQTFPWISRDVVLASTSAPRPG
jgi:hypothetical protein